MHILYFHQSFTTPDGSNGIRSYEFARALLARGHAVTMVCGKSEGSGLDLPWDQDHGWYGGIVEGIRVIALPVGYTNRDSNARRAWAFIRFAVRSMQIALNLEFDLLFASSTPLTAALPGIAMKVARRQKPFVFEVRDLWPELPRALGVRNPFLLGGMSFMEWLAYRCADLCVGLSPGIVEGIKKRSPKSRRIELLPNGCDTDLFKPEKRAGLNLPDIEPGDFVAGFTGAHGIANGLGSLLDSAAVLIRRQRSDIKVVFIGDGSQKPTLVKRAQRDNLTNCLFFPPIKKTELTRITASFGCGLQILADVPAFYYGTSPNKFFDYISSGIPVVNNYPGWLADLINEHQCGIAVPPQDPEALADALCLLADDDNTRKAMGARARALALDVFPREKIAARFAETIESL